MIRFHVDDNPQALILANSHYTRRDYLYKLMTLNGIRPNVNAFHIITLAIYKMALDEREKLFSDEEALLTMIHKYSCDELNEMDILDDVHIDWLQTTDTVIWQEVLVAKGSLYHSRIQYVNKHTNQVVPFREFHMKIRDKRNLIFREDVS